MLVSTTFSHGQRSICADLLNSYKYTYLFSTFTDTIRKPMKIGCADGVCSHLNHVLTASSASDSACSEQLQIYNKMLEWKRDSEGRTALLIEGARRIGKSKDMSKDKDIFCIPVYMVPYL